MADKTFLYIKKSWCKKCGICVDFCPQNVYKTDEKGYPEIVDIKKCTECRICIVMCPDFAIFAENKTVEEAKDK